MHPIRLNWIRPEDLHYYYELGIRHFKIQGRQNVVTGDVVKTLRYYIDEDFNGNLYDLITLFSPYNAFQPYMDNKQKYWKSIKMQLPFLKNLIPIQK